MRGLIHGTTTGYSHYKCRCVECYAAVAKYQRERKAAMAAGTWVPDRTKGKVRVPCTGPECDRLARYLHPSPLCGGHSQQLARGVELTPLKRKRFVVDGLKECRLCGERKPTTEFHPRGENRWASECKPCYRIYNRAIRYGITFAEAKEMVVAGCETCGSTERLHIDHDHESGRVRGTLCHNCNTVLTHHMTPEILRALADYLENS